MTAEHDVIWEQCLTILKDNLNLQSFKTWFEPIKPIAYKNDVLTIQVPSQFFYEWLEEHYVNLISKTIKRVIGDKARLEYKIVMDSNANDNPFTVQMPTTKTGAKPISEVDAPMSMGHTLKNPFVVPGLKKIKIDSNLNPNYTFDSFVEGDCNRLARSAGFAIANKPGGTAFNPFVVYGGVGLGKSHLVQAIGNQVKVSNSNKTVLYVSSEKFTNQFIESLKKGTVNDFIHFYQLVDVLIVDDIQFFANKGKTQEIFFVIFNHLHQAGKQLIFSSDVNPRDLENIQERLLSRFKWGLAADLQKPDYETRLAIIDQKMYADGVDLPMEVKEFIAYNIKENVRDLESALISLLAQATLNKVEIDIDLAKKIVKNFVKNISKEVSIDFIQKQVCEHFDVPVDLLKDKTRKRAIVQARQLSMYFAKQFTNKSLKSIGDFFGGRDHSTVIHSNQAIENLIETDEDFRGSVDQIRKIIEMNL